MNKENELSMKVLDIIKSSDKVESFKLKFGYDFFSGYSLKNPCLCYDREYYVCQPSGITILFLSDNYYGELKYIQVMLPGKKSENIILEKKIHKIRKTLANMHKEEKTSNALHLLLKLKNLKQR